MKKNITNRLSILMLVIGFAINSQAQIFDFGFPFGDSYGRRQQQQQVEAVTQPEYKGGNDALNKYLRKEFKAPQPVENIEGVITVACIISEKGKVIETGIVQGLSKAYNEEALRVAKKLKFKPAKRGKTKVKSRFDVSFPIRRGRLSFSKLQTIDV